MALTQRTFVDSRTAATDEAGWRFEPVAGCCREGGVEPDRLAVRRQPSLSWRLRH
jgi:hypothetical protein